MGNSKRFMSVGLYREGLRQLRFMGFVGGGLVVLASVAQAAGLNAAGVFDQGFGSVVAPTMLASSASLVVYLLPFLFVLRLFSFLNKRNRSDFYHALPASRLKLSFSLLAAALTWIWGIGLVIMALTLATSSIGGVAVAFPLAASALGLLLTASLFSAAATFLAVSITGTRFTNLVVTALIVLLPHLIASCFVQAVSSAAPNLPVGYVGLIGGVSIQNTFFMLSPLVMLVGASSAGPVSNGASIAVTFLWSVALIVLGAWLFARRPSETAGKSAPSRRLQLLYRVAVGVLVVAVGMSAVLGVSSLVDSGLMPDGPLMSGGTAGFFSTASIGSLVTLLVIALIVFLVFELIATRKWRRVVCALPSFGLVIIFALAFYGAIFLYSSYEKNFKPSVDQIVSVRLLSTQYGMDDMQNTVSDSDGLLTGGFNSGDGSLPTYNQLLLQQAAINDPAFLQATANKLRENFPADAAYGGTDEDHSAMLLEVRLKSGRTAFRLVNVRTGTKPDAFDQIMLTTPEVTRALLALPPLDKHVELSNYAFMPADGSSIRSPISAAQQDRQTRELYQVFKSEYEQLSPTEQYQALYGDASGNSLVPSADTTTLAAFTGGGGLDFSGILGTQAFSNSYDFITPRASEMSWEMTRAELVKLFAERPAGFYLDEIDLYTPQVMRAVSDPNDDSESVDPLWSIATHRWDDGTGVDSDSTLIINDAKMTEAAGIIQPTLSRGFALDAPYYVQISYGLYDKQGDEANSNVLIVPLTAQKAAALQALTKK